MIIVEVQSLTSWTEKRVAIKNGKFTYGDYDRFNLYSDKYFLIQFNVIEFDFMTL